MRGGLGSTGGMKEDMGWEGVMLLKGESEGNWWKGMGGAVGGMRWNSRWDFHGKK